MTKMIVNLMLQKLQRNKLFNFLHIIMFPKRLKVWSNKKMNWLESRKRRKRKISPLLSRSIRMSLLKIIMSGSTPGLLEDCQKSTEDSSPITEQGNIFVSKLNKVCRSWINWKFMRNHKNLRSPKRNPRHKRAIFGPGDSAIELALSQGSSQNLSQLKRTWWFGTNKALRNDLSKINGISKHNFN